MILAVKMEARWSQDGSKIDVEEMNQKMIEKKKPNSEKGEGQRGVRRQRRGPWRNFKGELFKALKLSSWPTRTKLVPKGRSPP